MKTSQNGIDLIKQFEGYRDKAYLCPAKVWTIGYGTTKYPDGKPVKQGDACTQPQAEEWLKNDLARFEKNVSGFVSYNWNQNEFDALVSFAYNLGSINQLTANGTRTRAQIAEAMPRYNTGGGVVLAGLTKRRACERELFLKPVTNAPVAAQGGETAPQNSTANTFLASMTKTLNLPPNATKEQVLMNTVTVSKTANSKHSTVRPIQELLAGIGYYKGSIDCSFGAQTEAATKTYQSKVVGLANPDGIWTGKTGKSYKKALGL